MKNALHPEEEIEVKFYLSQPARLHQRLRVLGAKQVEPRQYELNLRFDFPDRHLTREHRVLRLRRTYQTTLTYKGPAQPDAPVSARQEIEVGVSDFETARHLLEALGLEVSVIYEKWRTTYQLGAVEIVIDEMPYGVFCEIEGPDATIIEATARQLGLDWTARIRQSYLAMFEILKRRLRLSIPHLTFEAFAGIRVSASDLEVRPADVD
ncbi:class IV adenylate cyclase [uncultured Thermanaerothrix sp.]|uniref:class IV adenylate cyclase n=1 Tax=uncultured Thermanaerothrix sp. TaxID=1195149 RepID=UPI00261C6B81|nr:class IV adenylate cyclase [uncultured Thermanaerothrix sp.]